MTKQKNVIRLFSCLFVASMVVFAACKKETSAISSADEKNFTELSSNSTLETYSTFDDVFNNVMGVNDEVAFGQTGVFGRIITVDSFVNRCFTVEITGNSFPNIYPVKVVVDFGAGCTGKDGIIRKGKINTVYSGPLTVAGKVAETSFDNFFMNDTQIEGIHRIENTSTSSQLVFIVTIKDGKLTKPNGNYSQINSKNTIKQIDGSATPKLAMDDVMSITGESNGSIKNDSAFIKWNSKIEEPLIKKFTCRWFVKGKIGVLKVNTDAAIIDFGDGDCNNKAFLIINGLSTEITLH
ncbi:MAG: hypothetical protein ABIN89_29850 [Chitinophagaceae bacterium]